MGDELQDGIAPEQVETAEATTAPEQQPTETPAEGEVVQEEHPAEPPKKTGIEKRFSELTARAKAAEQYAARLEALMDRQQQYQAPPQQPAAPQGKPTREQFDYDEDRYLEALTDFKVNERLQAAQQQAQERQQERIKAERQQDYQGRIAKANEEGMGKFADYEDVVLANPDLVVTPVMADAMTYSDIASDLAYHLGRNPSEARRISQLPPQVQIMEIARLEAKMKAVPQKKQTQAPPPITPVGARGQLDIDPEKMSTEEWVRRRNAGEIK